MGSLACVHNRSKCSALIEELPTSYPSNEAAQGLQTDACLLRRSLAIRAFRKADEQRDQCDQRPAKNECASYQKRKGATGDGSVTWNLAPGILSIRMHPCFNPRGPVSLGECLRCRNSHSRARLQMPRGKFSAVGFFWNRTASMLRVAYDDVAKGDRHPQRRDKEEHRNTVPSSWATFAFSHQLPISATNKCCRAKQGEHVIFGHSSGVQHLGAASCTYALTIAANHRFPALGAISRRRKSLDPLVRESVRCHDRSVYQTHVSLHHRDLTRIQFRSSL